MTFSDSATGAVRSETTGGSPASIELYVDESEITLPGGKHLFIYAAICVRGLAKAIPAIAEVKAKCGLPGEMELKWNSPGGDSEKKAIAKDGFLRIVSQTCGALISCTEGQNKDEAFLSLLEDIKSQHVGVGPTRVRIVCDTDAFRNQSKIDEAVAAWPPHLVCEPIIMAESSTLLPIQFADLTAGAFGYRLACSFGREPKRIHLSEDDHGIAEEWPLNEYFRVMFRWSFWGGRPLKEWDGESDFEPEHQTLDFFNSGIHFHGDFSHAEEQIFHDVSIFYRGCMS